MHSFSTVVVIVVLTFFLAFISLSFRLSLSRKSKSLGCAENGYIWRVFYCAPFEFKCGEMRWCVVVCVFVCKSKIACIQPVNVHFVPYHFDFVIFIRSHRVHNQWTHIINMSVIFSWHQRLKRTQFTTAETTYHIYMCVSKPNPTNKFEENKKKKNKKHQQLSTVLVDHISNKLVSPYCLWLWQRSTQYAMET